MSGRHIRLNRKALHDFIFTLWYPAILGSMIVALIVGHPLPPEGIAPWGWVLVFYFAAQHTVALSHGDPTTYPRYRFVQHIVEIILIVLAFHLLGVLPDAALPAGWAVTALPYYPQGLLALIFLLPIVFRGLFNRSAFKTARGKSLSVLSFLAAAVAGVCPGSLWSLVAVSVLLLIYFGFFVLTRSEEDSPAQSVLGETA